MEYLPSNSTRLSLSRWRAPVARRWTEPGLAHAGAAAISTLWICNCESATDEDIRRGLDAARDVLASHGVTATHAHAAALAQAGSTPLAAHESRLAVIWQQTEAAALAACFAGLPRIPEDAVLVVIQEP